MGGRHSHNHLDLTDSESDQDPINDHDDHDDVEEEEEEDSLTEKTDVNLHCLRSHLDSLSIRRRKGSDQGSGNEKAKLYRYVFMGSGRISTDQKSPWILVAKDVSWDFRRGKDKEEEEEEDDGEEGKGNEKGRETGKGSGKPNVKEEDKEYYNDDHVNEAKANFQAKPKLKPKQMLKEEEEELEYGSGDEEVFSKPWFFIVGSKVKSRVSEKLQLKFYSDKVRVDFVSYGHVWSLKFGSENEYKRFEIEFHDRLFENTFTLEATEANKIKVFGKDFVGWAKPEEADESIWEDAEESFNCKPSFKGETSFDKRFVKSSVGGQLFEKSLNDKSSFDKRFETNSPNIVSKTFQEAFIEPCKGATIQSLTMGALDHSFLVSANGIEAMKNFPSGIHGKGISIAFDNEMPNNSYSTTSTTTPKKAMLMKRESNLMVLSPSKELSGSNFTPHHHSSSGLHQVDIESGKVVAKWKFEKDGTPIQMRDVTNETKSSQLDPTRSTFLGLDDNRLCRWDMRDPHGIVEDLNSPILNWAEGHQFSKGTNFQCFATTGDGAIVVGSKDGKIRLYGTTSMRMAKTAFPGLGSPITHVDVTYDGKWILATTDSYMILISSVFRDKDGKIKTGFTGRMGNNIAAPRLLKLSPLDAHLAGKGYKFHGGQFSWVTESGRQERNLVASVGKFTVIWNFRRVKESNHECYRVTQGLKSCYCYRIIPKEESIVDSKFMHDNTSSVSPLLVATPKKVSCFNV